MKTNSFLTHRIIRIALAVLAAGLLGQSTQAADSDWNQTDTPNDWSLNTNWTPNSGVGGPSAAGTSVLINTNIAATSTINLFTTGNPGTATKTIGRLDIGDTNNTNSFVIAAGTGSGILAFDNSGTGAQLNQLSTSKGDTVSAPISLLDHLTVSNAANINTLTLSGATITGAKNLTLNANGTGAINVTAASVNNGGTITNSGSGSGTVTVQTGVIGTGVTGVVQDSATSQLTLSGTNTFTSGVTIKKGTVLANADAALGTGTLLLGDTSGNSNATLLINGFTLANNITVQAGSTGNTATIASNGGVAARLTGNLLLNKDVTLTVNGGANGSRNSGAYLAQTAGTLTGAGALNLNVTGNISTTNNNGVPVMDSLNLAAVASTGAINNIGTGTGRAVISGNITAASSVNQNSDSSVFSLSGAGNTYSGATNVNAGVLRIAATGALSTASAFTVASGGTLLLSTNSATAISAASLTISGHGASSATGALAAVNTANYGGTVTLAADSTISSDLNGSTTFTLSAANSVTGSNKTLTVTGLDHTTISGTITTGSGGLIKLGEGRLTLSGANTFTGLTQVNRGTINLNNVDALGGGGNLTFGGGTLQYSASNTTDFGSRIVNSTGSIALDTNAQARTLSSVAASNVAGVTKLGTGTLTLSGTNSYVGITAVNAGNVTVSATSALPGQIFLDTNGAVNSGGAYSDVTAWLGSGKIVSASTGLVALTGNSSENINFSGFSALGLGASSASTYTGTITPAGAAYRLGGGGATLTLSGTNALTGANALAVNGAVTLTASNDLSGATTVTYNSTGGSNTLTLSGANGKLAGSAITVAPTATLAIVADTTATVATRAGSVTLNRGSLTVAGNATANSTDAITGAFTVGSDGLSTVTLTPNAGKNALLTAGSYVRNPGGTVLLRGTNLGVNAFGTANTASIQFTTPNLVGNGGTGTDRSIFVGALGSTATNGGGFGTNGGLLTQDATNGVRILSGADYKTSIGDGQTALDNVQLTSTSGTATTTLSAATTINSLSLNSTTVAGANVQVTGSGTLTLNSGVIYANSATATTPNGISNTVNFNGKEGFIAVGGTNTLVLSGVLEGTTNGMTVYAPSRSVTFSGASANTYTGTTTVNGGTLILSKTGGAAAIAGDLVVNAGATVAGNSGAGGNNQIADAANVTVNGGTFISANETIAGLAIENGGTFNLVNPSSGNPGLAFVVSGDASVSGYGANVASSLSMGPRGNSLTIGGTLSLSDGGRLVVTSSQNVTGTIDGWANVGGLSITNRASGAYTAVTISPSINSNATQKGGQLILNGDVVFTGNTSNANTVFIEAPTGAGTQGNIALRGASAGNRTFNIGDGAAANDLTIASAMVDGSGGASGLVKTGAGALALTGASTYTGATTVTTGTLLVNGSLTGSAVTVAIGATLGGSGTVSGATTTIQSGGTLSPGNSPGVAIYSNLTLDTGAIFKFELAANSISNRGTDFDGVNILAGGSLAIGAGVNSNLVFNASGSTVDWNNGLWSSNQSWLVFDLADGGYASNVPVVNSLSVDSLGQTLGSVRSGASFSYAISGGDIYLNYTAVPEPATWALLAFSLTTVLVLRRRRA